MEEHREHTLEGLLKARARDLGRRRPKRARGPLTEAASTRADPPRHGREGVAGGRTCETCRREIDPRRVHALPHASRCLGCQRAHELATARS